MCSFDIKITGSVFFLKKSIDPCFKAPLVKHANIYKNRTNMTAKTYTLKRISVSFSITLLLQNVQTVKTFLGHVSLNHCDRGRPDMMSFFPPQTFILLTSSSQHRTKHTQTECTIFYHKR